VGAAGAAAALVPMPACEKPVAPATMLERFDSCMLPIGNVARILLQDRGGTDLLSVRIHQYFKNLK
jgi:hypothetical protein